MPEDQQKKNKSVLLEQNETSYASSDESDYSEHNELQSDNETFASEVSNSEEILEAEELLELALIAQQKKFRSSVGKKRFCINK